LIRATGIVGRPHFVAVRWPDRGLLSSNPRPDERANAIRPRSAHAGHNIVVRNRPVRTRKRRNTALVPRALRQGWPLPPGRRRLERRENHDAIGRPLPSGSQPHRLRLSRQARVWPGLLSSHDLHFFASIKFPRPASDRGFGRSTPHHQDCKSPAHGRHWRSSTIGSSLSNAVVDKCHPGIDCRHGHLRLVLSVTDWTGR
jgi:hypothetical protein